MTKRPSPLRGRPRPHKTRKRISRSLIVVWARRRGLKLDRDTYLAACYPQGLPEWTAELESEVPDEFRH